MATATPVSANSTPPPALVRALRHVLKPLVRLSLAHSITFPFLAELLKSLYVEVAAREFALADKPQTDSRITLLTGVHRKEVKRLRHEPPAGHEPPGNVSLGAQLIARWSGMPEYLDARGRPRPLARVAKAADEPSFERLVQSVSTDIRPRAVLDEWLRLGIARVDADERIELVTEAFVPQRGFDEKAFYFGRNLRDHLAASAHNLGGGEPPLLERSVYHGDLTAESVQALAEEAQRLGMEALQSLNRLAYEHKQRDTGSARADRRFTFGVYFYSEPQAADDAGRGPGARDD